jgi:hypothetical protein
MPSLSFSHQFLLLSAIPLGVLSVAADSPARGGIYDPDPRHPWNRLHRLLHTRTTQDGKLYDQEELEPPLLPSSKFLTEGPSHQEALALLDEFLQERSAGRIKDPVKRAVLQRDLWAVFSILTGGARKTYRENPEGRTELNGIEDAGDAELKRQSQRREVQRRLAQIMRQIALSPEEINALPDNLADALKAGRYPTRFDPKHPERPFLPAELLEPDGPWVAVRNPDRADGLAAPEHVKFTKGRALFLVLVRAPGGRKATDVLVKTASFPPGTQVALLRRTFLVDRTGTLRPTRLTESLQLRVLGKPKAESPGFEFVLSRGEFFANRGGGLRPVGRAETSHFNFGFAGDMLYRPDPFEARDRPQPLALLNSCRQCHGDDSGGSRVATAFAAGREVPVYPSEELQRQIGKTILSYSEKPALAPTEEKRQIESTMNWGRKTYTWGLLQGMWR